MLTRPRGHMHTDKHARSCVCTVCSHAYACAHMCTYGMLVCMHMHGQVCVLTRAHSTLAHSHACTESALTPITRKHVCSHVHIICLHRHMCVHTYHAQTHAHLACPPCQSRVWVVSSPEGARGPGPGAGSHTTSGFVLRTETTGGAVRAGGQGPGTPADSLDAQQGPRASNGNTPRPPLRSPSVSVFSAE